MYVTVHVIITPLTGTNFNIRISEEAPLGSTAANSYLVSFTCRSCPRFDSSCFGFPCLAGDPQICVPVVKTMGSVVSCFLVWCSNCAHMLRQMGSLVHRACEYSVVLVFFFVTYFYLRGGCTHRSVLCSWFGLVWFACRWRRCGNTFLLEVLLCI